MPPAKRAAVIGGAVLVFLVFLGAMAEGAVRGRQWLKYGFGPEGINSIYSIDPETGLRAPIPGTVTRTIQINDLGFRGPDITAPKPDGRIRIAFLGGSTTFCAEVSSNEATWPHLVTEALRQEWPEREFDYVNASVGGFGTKQSLDKLRADVQVLDPDIVVIYHATNDLTSNSRVLARAQGYQSQNVEQRKSWLAQYSVAWDLIEKNLIIWTRQNQITTEKFQLDLELPALSKPFKTDLASLVTASFEIADLVAIATFSTQLRPSQSLKRQREAAVTSLYYMPYMTPQTLIEAFAAYNDVMENVAGETGAVAILGEHSIPGDTTHFVDSVHLTDAGSRLMAQRVAGGLINSGKLDQITASGSRIIKTP